MLSHSRVGDHTCLVFEPLREPLWLLNERFVGKTIPSAILKIMVEMLLRGLDYLHTECKIIHTGKDSVNIFWLWIARNRIGLAYHCNRSQARQYHGQA